jgi:hypothetical protein
MYNCNICVSIYTVSAYGNTGDYVNVELNLRYSLEEFLCYGEKSSA